MPTLHLACSKGNVEQIKKAIEIDNYDPMQADHSGLFPLHYATINNHPNCVKVNTISNNLHEAIIYIYIYVSICVCVLH